MDFSAKNLKTFLPAAAIALLAWGICCWLVYAQVHPSLVEKFHQKGEKLRQESLQNQREAVETNGLRTYPAIMDIVQSIDQKIEDIPFLERRKAFLSHTLGFENAGPLLQNQVIDELIPQHDTILVSLMDRQGNLLARNESGIQKYDGVFHPSNGQPADTPESPPDDAPESKEDGDRVSVQNIEGRIFIHAVRHIWSSRLSDDGNAMIDEVMGKIDLIAISPIQLPAMPEAQSKANQRFTLYAFLVLPAFLALSFAGAGGVSRWKQTQAAQKAMEPTPKPKANSPAKKAKTPPSADTASSKVTNRPPAPKSQNPASPAQSPAHSPSISNPGHAHKGADVGDDDLDDLTVAFEPPLNRPSQGASFDGQTDVPPHGSESKDKLNSEEPKTAPNFDSPTGPRSPAPKNATNENATATASPEIGQLPKAANNTQREPYSDIGRTGRDQANTAKSGFPTNPEDRPHSPPSSAPLEDEQSSQPSDHPKEAVDPDATNVYRPKEAMDPDATNVYPTHVARNRSESPSAPDANGTNPTSHTEDDETRFSMISLEIGDRVDEYYDILEIIGKGGAGVVYKVQDPVMNRLFAIKVLSNKKLIKRFINEANVGIELHHDNIVKVHPLRKDKHHGFYYLLMDFIDGCNLKRWLRENPEITYREVLYILERVCAGLQYAHDKDTCHRDIKPENIMVSKAPDEEYPRVSLVDFGLSKLKGGDGDLTRFGGVGTLKYMPPEQHRGQSNFKADIYSVGYVSFLMLSGGELPEEPGMTNIHEVSPVVPEEVGDVLNVAMNYYPSKRHESISQFYEELRDAITDSGLDVAKSVTMNDVELKVEEPTE